jgi:mannose-6-phosphate isomerase
MNQKNLYPLQFEPIFQYRLWGGRSLENIFQTALPGDGPIGEAWLLSDRDDQPSRVANGPLKGLTIGQLIDRYGEQLLGELSGRFSRFPLLLKFLDAKEMLSVQVHPSDTNTNYLPAGKHGKTEAWIVLEASPESRIFTGLIPGTTPNDLQQAIKNDKVADKISYFIPKTGDGVFIPAGTVHTLGDGVVIFEVQQNSDVTFRLYDWGHVDANTGKPRALQVDEALACINFEQAAKGPVEPVVENVTSVLRERLFLCEQFVLWRLSGVSPFIVGSPEMPHALVCIAGSGRIEFDGSAYGMGKGDVFLLPASVGECLFRTKDYVCLLEISMPEGKIT